MDDNELPLVAGWKQNQEVVIPPKKVIQSTARATVLPKDVRHEKIKQSKSAFRQSTKLAVALFRLVTSLLATIMIIVFWQGSLTPNIRLSDKVLIVLLSTTTANILGLLCLLMKYMFHQRLKLD